MPRFSVFGVLFYSNSKCVDSTARIALPVESDSAIAILSRAVGWLLCVSQSARNDESEHSSLEKQSD